MAMYPKLVSHFMYKGITLFSIICICLSIFSLLKIIASSELPDFNVYYQTVKNIYTTSNPYNISSNGMHFIYPPTALFLLLPLKIFTLQQAKFFWTIGSYLSLLVSVYCLLKISLVKFTWKYYLPIISLALISFPVKFTLGMGQINLYILLLLSLCFVLYKTHHIKFAALCLSIAIGLKLSPIILLTFFLIKKQYSLIAYTVILLFVFYLLSTILLGQDLLTYYFQSVFSHLPTIGNASYYNQALSGFLARARIPDNFSQVINVTIFATLAILAGFKTWSSNSKTELQSFGLWVVLPLIAGGLAWQHHLALLVLPLITLLQKRKYTLLLLHIYLLFAVNIPSPGSFSSIPLVLSHGLMASLGIMAILLLT